MGEIPTRVRKRDGWEERFDDEKLVMSLQLSLGFAGMPADEAVPLAQVVAQALGLRGPDTTTARIAAAVEAALEETGYDRAAATYREYRNERDEARARWRVHGREQRRIVASPWDRDRLMQSLVRTRYLERHSARAVALAVELRLLALDYVHLTSRLIGALVDNECRTHGLRGESLASERVGPSRADLRAWLGGQALPTGAGCSPAVLGAGEDARPHLGGEILARFAMEELLTRPQVEAWEDGLFDLPGLTDWLRPARVRLVPGVEESEEAFWTRVGESCESAREVQVVWPASRKAGALTRRAPAWLERPGTRLRLETASATLARHWTAAGLWVRMPAQAFAAAQAATRRELKESKRVSLWWAPMHATAEAGHDQVLDNVAVINLPAAARSVEAFDRPAFLDRVREATDLACSAVRTLARRGRGCEHPQVCLLPAGLGNALVQLLPGKLPESDPVRHLLLGMRELFSSRPRAAGIRSCDVAPPHPEAAGARLAQRDEGGQAAYPVTWSLAPADTLPSPIQFEFAPWLDFSAAAVDPAATRRLRTLVPASGARRGGSSGP